MTTGVGAALNKVDIRPGESVAVYGCGCGGLNVVQGARLSGANPIIAVDPDPSKLEIARQFGATDGVIAGKEARAGVRALSGGRGADYASHDGTVSKVQRRLDAGWRKLVAGPRWLAEGDRGVVIVKRDKDADGLRPLAHSPLTRVSPGKDFDPPPSAMHPFQRAVKPASYNVTSSVSGQQGHNARITVVVPTVLEHS